MASTIMKINEILLESTYHPLPAIETVFESEWDRQPVKYLGWDDQEKIHNSEEIPYDDQYNNSMGKYTRDSKIWNDFLHRHYRGKAKPKEFERYGKHVSAIDQALTKNVFKKDYTLYTGLKESPALAFKLYDQPTDKPITVHLPAYTSTSTNFHEAEKFARDIHVNSPKYDRSGHELLTDKGKKLKTSPALDKYNRNSSEVDMLRIFVPAGTTGGSVKYHSRYHDENEVLLPRGLNIMISPRPQVYKTGFYIIYIWNAKVVGHTPQPVVFDQKD